MPSRSIPIRSNGLPCCSSSKAGLHGKARGAKSLGARWQYAGFALLAAGEFRSPPAVYEYSIEDLKTKGAPVDWIGLEPVITYTVAASLPSRPNNPNSAKLFIEWLLSKEGQEVINQYGRVPIRDDVESRYGKILKQHKLLMTDIDLGQKEAKSTKPFASCFSKFVEFDDSRQPALFTANRNLIVNLLGFGEVSYRARDTLSLACIPG